MTREPDAPARSLVEEFHSLDARTPEGYRAELLDGAITVTPPPDGNHERWIARILSQVIRNSSEPVDGAGHKGLIAPSRGQDVSAHVIPDITLALRELDLFLDAPPWMPAAGVAMVVEVTSSLPGRDRDAKRHAYAEARQRGGRRRLTFTAGHQRRRRPDASAVKGRKPTARCGRRNAGRR